MIEHEARNARVWLPSFQGGGFTGNLTQHRYCHLCGKIEGNGRPIGFFLDHLGQICTNLTRVQRHMISQELFKRELFTDHFGSIFELQVEQFAKIVERYTDRPADWTMSLFYWPG